MGNSDLATIIYEALKDIQYSAGSDVHRFLAVVQDLAVDYPQEKKYLYRNMDEKLLRICDKALGCNEYQIDAVRKEATRYLQQDTKASPEWAEVLSEALIAGFYAYGHNEGIEKKSRPTPKPKNEKGSNNYQRRGITRSQFVVGAVVAAIIIAVIAFAVLGDRQGNEEESVEPTIEATETATETATEAVASQVKTAAESVIYDDVDPNLPITSLRMEFDSIKTIGDGIISTDVVFLLSNHTGYDVTGFAFKAYNKDGDKAEIKNRDKNCESDAPFYAEGYLPDGGNGVMVSEMIISKEDFRKLNPEKDGHRLKPKCIFLTEAYVFRETTDYRQPTGRLFGPYKDESSKVKYYSVEIDNDNESPVHAGARIVAMRRDDENSGSIRKRSAKGSVDREIPVGSQGFTIERTFNNSGLERWPADDYEVYVIDNEYSDGSHYYDSYRLKYGK